MCVLELDHKMATRLLERRLLVCYLLHLIMSSTNFSNELFYSVGDFYLLLF